MRMPLNQLPGESVAQARMRDHLAEARQGVAFEASAVETATGVDVQRPIMHPVWNPLRTDDCANLTWTGIMKTMSDPGLETQAYSRNTCITGPLAEAVLSTASPPELLSDELTFGGLTSGSLTQQLICNDTRWLRVFAIL
jgi:hypothetical protein